MNQSQLDSKLKCLYEIWIASGSSEQYSREMAYFGLKCSVQQATDISHCLKIKGLNRLAANGKLEAALFLTEVFPQYLEKVKDCLSSDKLGELLDEEIATLRADLEKSKR